jgi:hypothetical protein
LLWSLPLPVRSAQAKTDLDPGFADIRSFFNINLGNPGCLDGTMFYLGVDGSAGSRIDLGTTALPEFAHGLGFTQTIESISVVAEAT